MANPQNPNPQQLFPPLILYDGVCNFCNAIVNFIIKKDKQKHIYFLPIQNPRAREILRNFNEPFIGLKTVYFIENKYIYRRSQAVFMVLEHLPYPWKLFAVFKYLPKWFCDFFYKIIANNRYYLFGKSDQVIKPDERVKERFLE